MLMNVLASSSPRPLPCSSLSNAAHSWTHVSPSSSQIRTTETLRYQLADGGLMMPYFITPPPTLFLGHNPRAAGPREATCLVRRTHRRSPGGKTCLLPRTGALRVGPTLPRTVAFPVHRPPATWDGRTRHQARPSGTGRPYSRGDGRSCTQAVLRALGGFH